MLLHSLQETFLQLAVGQGHASKPNSFLLIDIITAVRILAHASIPISFLLIDMMSAVFILAKLSLQLLTQIA